MLHDLHLVQCVSLLLSSSGWVLSAIGFVPLAMLGVTLGTHAYVNVQARDAQSPAQ